MGWPWHLCAPPPGPMLVEVAAVAAAAAAAGATAARLSPFAAAARCRLVISRRPSGRCHTPPVGRSTARVDSLHRGEGGHREGAGEGAPWGGRVVRGREFCSFVLP